MRTLKQWYTEEVGLDGLITLILTWLYILAMGLAAQHAKNTPDPWINFH